MKFQILILISLLAFSCYSEDLSHEVKEATIEELQFQTTLLKLHETPLNESEVDKLRIIVSTPYGGKLFASTILKYDDLWMYSKSLQETTHGHTYDEKLLISNSKESVDIWTQFTIKFNQLRVEENVHYPRLSDDVYALLEIKEGENVSVKEVVLCKSTSWIKDLMEGIYDEKLDLFIPECID